MKPFLVLVSFGLACAASATEVKLPSPGTSAAPVVAPVPLTLQTPSLTGTQELLKPGMTPILGPSVVLGPNAIVSPITIVPAAATPVAAPVAATAREQLIQTARALAPREGKAVQPEQANAALFDGAVAPSERLREAAELAVFSIPVHLPAAIGYGLSDGHASFPLVMAAIWHAGSAAMVQHLGAQRQTVVGGWQASHDQRYRTNYSDGQMRDIRGRAYGTDRYEEYAPGPVSVKERSAIAVFAAAMGLIWTAQHGLSSSLLFLAAMIGLTALSLRRRRA